MNEIYLGVLSMEVCYQVLFELLEFGKRHILIFRGRVRKPDVLYIVRENHAVVNIRVEVALVTSAYQRCKTH